MTRREKWNPLNLISDHNPPYTRARLDSLLCIAQPVCLNGI
jgi:hypothetical protein